MDNRHRLDARGVAFGGVAYCAPALSRDKRGVQEADLAASERPRLEHGRDMGRRADAAAIRKRIARNVCRKLIELFGRWVEDEADVPLRRGVSWFGENKNGPIRNIASKLRRLSSVAVGK